MAFKPKTAYRIISKPFPIKDFAEYKDEFVVRPPYQRKTVWGPKKKRDLLDSLFRRFYIPNIVIREVRLSQEQYVNEVIDGQQRITTVQEFFADAIRLPATLEDVHPGLAGARYSELPVELRRFIDNELKYDAAIILDIDNPNDVDHQRIASEIFWRLQQGEPLKYMEIAHARLSSLVRNFVVKYADDYDFDYKAYRPIDNNPYKLPFFRIYDRDNTRMQHLSLLTRLLLLEREDGPTETRDKVVADFIDNEQTDDGIGNTQYEKTSEARAVINNLQLLYEIFKDDSMLDETTGLKEFRVEYFVISVYLLLRHLVKYYVFAEHEQALFREFVIDFHTRWKSDKEHDTDMLVFKDNRQQSKAETEIRHRIMRQLFFEYANKKAHKMLTKDTRRAFSESERIAIYRRDNGLCQICLGEGKSEKEATVTWKDYEADHVIPFSRGGATTIENGQVLCQVHNRRKGANVSG